LGIEWLPAWLAGWEEAREHSSTAMPEEPAYDDERCFFSLLSNRSGDCTSIVARKPMIRKNNVMAPRSRPVMTPAGQRFV